jgi:transcriptional regulator with XRE-family HTH domain
LEALQPIQIIIYGFKARTGDKLSKKEVPFMANIKLHEQLVSLRRQRGLTQEELAQVFGVTNQAVSKWESGACCPDISLLPDIANFYEVSIDELFVHLPTGGLNGAVRIIKRLFTNTPGNESFGLAFKLALYLHEGAVSKGYKDYLPWDAGKERKSDKDYYKWGSSVCSEPEGVTVMKGNSVLLVSDKYHRQTEPNEITAIWSEIQKYADIDRLTVFFALYELTREDFNLFVGIDSIAEKAKINEEKVHEAFKWLPIHRKRLDDGSFGYRIEGSNMHIPALLRLFLNY